jgi:hypothetical protein
MAPSPTGGERRGEFDEGLGESDSVSSYENHGSAALEEAGDGLDNGRTGEGEDGGGDEQLEGAFKDVKFVSPWFSSAAIGLRSDLSATGVVNCRSPKDVITLSVDFLNPEILGFFGLALFWIVCFDDDALPPGIFDGPCVDYKGWLDHASVAL